MIWFLLAAVSAFIIEEWRRWYRTKRCMHLHPDLLSTDGGVSLFRCLDCGTLNLEGSA